MLGGKGREARSQLIDGLHKRISGHAEQVYWKQEDLKAVIMMDHKKWGVVPGDFKSSVVLGSHITYVKLIRKLFHEIEKWMLWRVIVCEGEIPCNSCHRGGF